MRHSICILLGIVLSFCLISCNSNRPVSNIGFEQRQISDRSHADGPRILCVVAHPDDEAAFAACLYKTTTMLNGVCDLFMITNGEGGFKYASLGESIYNAELTDEKIGRALLPDIRADECAAGCEIMGLRHLYMLRQKDHRYTRDPNEVLKADPEIWDLELVRRSIRTLIDTENYDFIFVHTPVEDTHGHHKSATILALEVIKNIPVAQRPCILGARTRSLGSEFATYQQLTDFPITAVDTEHEFIFDRLQAFGYKKRLNYKIIVNWVIAEHKSQGTMQLGMNRGDQEVYNAFTINSPEAIATAQAFFKSLEAPQFTSKTYGYGGGVPK